VAAKQAEIESPYKNKPISAHDAEVGMIVFMGRNSKSKKKGANYESSLYSNAPYKIDKVNEKSFRVTDMLNGETYLVQKDQWSTVNINDSKIIPLELYVLNDVQVEDLNRGIAKNKLLAPRYSLIQDTAPTTNPHTTQSLQAAFKAQLDKKFGDGWADRLISTKKIKFIERSEINNVISTLSSKSLRFYGFQNGEYFNDFKIKTGEELIDDYLSVRKDNLYDAKKANVEKNKSLYAYAVNSFLKGASFNSISSDIGISTPTIRRVFEDIGINEVRNKIEKKLDDILLDMYNKKMSANKISSELNIDISIVLKRLKENGIDVSRHLLSSEQRKAVVDLYNQGEPTKEIASLFGIGNNTVGVIIQNSGGVLRTNSESLAISIKKNGANIRSVRTPFQSLKNNKWIIADSSYELARFIELEKNNNVKRYTKDVDVVKYNGGANTYLPDILVEYNDGTKEVEEIKSTWQLDYARKVDDLIKSGMSIEDIAKTFKVSEKYARNLKLLNEKLSFAKEHYKSLGVNFKIITENDIDKNSFLEANYSGVSKLSRYERRIFRNELKNNPEYLVPIKYSQENGNIQAFYNPVNDTTYFVADNIEQDKNLVGLALHEIATHQLQLLKSSAEFQAIMENLVRSSYRPAVRDAIDTALKSFGIKTIPKAGQPIDGVSREDVQHEIAAYLLEENSSLSIVQKLIQWFRNAIRALGKGLPILERAKWFKSVAAINESDIIAMATSALRGAPESLLFDDVGRVSEAVKQSNTLQIFKDLDSRTSPDVRNKAVQDVVNNPNADRIMYINNNIVDILSKLEEVEGFEIRC